MTEFDEDSVMASSPASSGEAGCPTLDIASANGTCLRLSCGCSLTLVKIGCCSQHSEIGLTYMPHSPDGCLVELNPIIRQASPHLPPKL